MQQASTSFLKFRVVKNTPLGKGCVATKKIVAGEIICKMQGPVISLKQLLEKYDGDARCNPLQVGADSYIDLEEPFVYFNHSCSPNAGIRNNGILFAIKNIQVGDEIFYDYSTTVDERMWQMNCRCKAPNCRKIICDYVSVPHDQKIFYVEKGALTDHVITTYY
jgi:uncharacterized protein